MSLEQFSLVYSDVPNKPRKLKKLLIKLYKIIDKEKPTETYEKLLERFILNGTRYEHKEVQHIIKKINRLYWYSYKGNKNGRSN